MGSYPRTLGGCAMLSGYVPCTAAFKEAATPEGLSTRLLWLHGIHDAVVLTDAATAQAKMLLELGMSLDFRLSFDYGHETTDEELQALKHWLVVAIPQPEPEEDESDVPDYELPEGAENAEALYGEVQVRKTKAQKKAEREELHSIYKDRRYGLKGDEKRILINFQDSAKELTEAQKESAAQG